MDEQPFPYLKATLRAVTALARWLHEHWAITAGTTVAVVGTWLGIRG